MINFTNFIHIIQRKHVNEISVKTHMSCYGGDCFNIYRDLKRRTGIMESTKYPGSYWINIQINTITILEI